MKANYEEWKQFKREMLNSELKARSMDRFEQNLEIGWDYAIEQLTNSNPSNDLCVLIGLYYQAYKTEEYKQTGDPDSGLCYKIRKFAIQKILEVLNNV